MEDTNAEADLICYQIRNILSNRKYIGITNNLPRRAKQHINLLENGAHHSKELQEDFEFSGKDNFVFEELYKTKFIDYEQKNFIEKIYINSYSNLYNSLGYVNPAIPKYGSSATKPILFRYQGDTFDANEAEEIITLINSLDVGEAVEFIPVKDVYIDLLRGKLNSYFGRSSFGRYNGYKLTTKTMKDREDKYLIIKVIDMLPER